jgi:dihydroorotase
VLVIRGGRLIDPATGRDEIGDLWVSDGVIVEPLPELPSAALAVIDAEGLIVAPGLIDMHVHLREPGHEYRETIRSGARAAAAGGWTGIACMPDTSPAIDNAELVRFIHDQARAAAVRVHVVGAITRGRQGEQLAEIGEMAEAGIVGISDDDRPVDHPAIMRRALEYARMFDLPVIAHCEDRRLSGDGVMHESIMSTALGLKGIPPVAEESVIVRDIMLTELTGGRLHIAHVSTAAGVALIREAKRRGVRVTADVTPHHLTLTDRALHTYDTNLKVNPPLRTNRDVEALRAGLADGTIDAIASDHAPYSFDEKYVEYNAAPFGVIGLETTLGVVMTDLVQPGHLTLAEAIRAMTTAPARILGLQGGSLQPGKPADVTLFDPRRSWTVTPETFFSRSRNTPFGGRTLAGRATHTMVAGRIINEETA